MELLACLPRSQGGGYEDMPHNSLLHATRQVCEAALLVIVELPVPGPPESWIHQGRLKVSIGQQANDRIYGAVQVLP